MRNSKSNCIFKYDDIIYIVDFDKMVAWLHSDEDEDPISVLSLYRVKSTDWRYRNVESKDGYPWIIDQDPEFVKQLEDRYIAYINQVIVGKNARSKIHKTPDKR